MQDVINFSFQGGYFDIGNNVDVPEGVIISPSSNVLYDKNGRLSSVKQSSTAVFAKGGNRSFVLDRDLVAFLGTSSVDAVGNILQGVGKSLWFVGNSTSSGRVVDYSTGTEKTIGGRREELSVSVQSGQTLTAGTFTVTFTGTDVSPSFSGSVTVVTSPTSDTTSTIATKIADLLNTSSQISQNYQVYSSGDKVIVIDEQVRTNDFSVVMSSTTTCKLDANSSSLVGSTEFPLSSTPQFCKWDAATSTWYSPVSVGLAEMEDVPGLSLTTTATRGVDFTGLVIGSRSVRVARKRYGAVSIASPSSEVITASEKGDSLIVTIPVPDPDYSAIEDNGWFLYFTYKGLGSTSTHKLFPIEIPEDEVSGIKAATLHQQGNAKFKVIKSSSTTQADRQVEIEFNDNELVVIEPFEDYYPAESCKFLAKLGNVMCLIGSGTDSTGFDVSYPNYHEAYSPDWRDWFAEVPVSIATEQDMGFFWVSTANNTYLAQWTGVTQGSAPVLIEKRSSIYGTIGEGATVCVNGMLYSLTRGKTPIVISPDGQVNDKFGAMVKNSFASFTEDTRLGWDEATNSVVFTCQNTCLAFQIDTNKWSAPISTGTGADHYVRTVFSINGNMHFCKKASSVFSTYKWNTGTSDVSWNVTSAFQFGQSARALKDIIQVEGIFSSDVASGTITFKAYKNFSTSGTGIELISPPVTIAATGSQVTVRKYAESLDYDNVSARIDGTKGGQTIHNAMYMVDVHTIERLS